MADEDVLVTVEEETILLAVDDENEPMIVVVNEGVRGDPGSGGETAPATYTAGTGSVNAYQVVFMTTAGTVQAANANNETHAGRIVGMTLSGAAEGDAVQVQHTGSIANPAWTLEPGSRYYLQAGGEIGTTTDGIRFVQKIGIAETPNSLLLQIDPPIVQ